MAWADFFRSRYVRLLEAELNSARKNHLEELEALKKTHAEERDRCILETNRAWGEADRLRQYLVPGMPVADRSPQAPDNSPTPELDLTQIGTPFQRLKAKSYLEQEAAAKAEAAKKVPPVPPA
jgi:hypothetical protein